MHDIIRIESFHVPSADDRTTLGPLVEYVKEHVQVKPAWTALSISRLAMPTMLLEIQVTACVL